MRLPATRSLGFIAVLLHVALPLAPLPTSANDSRFDTASLEALLRKSPATGMPVDSIGELIPLLPRDLRSNFTFVYDSRSPFRSSISPAYPRAILFLPDARLVLTFTGDPEKPGFDVLESLSFDDRTARFELRIYPLPAARRRGWQPSAENSNCANCHGSDPRPIFDSYPVWPGFYGSIFDTFLRDRPGEIELKNYRDFLAGNARKQPYENLVFPDGSFVAPYLDPPGRDHVKPAVDASNVKFLPNTRLGMALTELNRSRLYRKLAEGKDFKANEKRFLAVLLECKHARSPSRADLRNVEQQLHRENDARLRRLGFAFREPHSPDEDMQERQFTRELAEVVEIARDAGANRPDWSMALEPRSLAFFDGILSGSHKGKSFYLKEDFIFEILGHLAQRDPAFEPYYDASEVFKNEGYPFGTRPDLGKALKSCRALRAN